MNDCALMQERISRMLDDDLSADERAALAKHLESCESCRTLYEAFAAVSASLGEELEEPPKRLRENVMAAVRREEIRQKNRRPWRAALAAAAVLALVLGLRAGILPRMGNAPMSAAVQEFAAAPAEEAALEAETAAVGEEIRADEAAVTEESALKSAAPETALYAANAAAAAVPAAGAQTAQSAGAVSREEIDLSTLRFVELLDKLGGEPTELRLDTLGELRSVTVICADNMLALFEYDGDWYYYDPIDPAPRRSALTPDELRALARD